MMVYLAWIFFHRYNAILNILNRVLQLTVPYLSDSHTTDNNNSKYSFPFEELNENEINNFYNQHVEPAKNAKKKMKNFILQDKTYENKSTVTPFCTKRIFHSCAQGSNQLFCLRMQLGFSKLT